MVRLGRQWKGATDAGEGDRATLSRMAGGRISHARQDAPHIREAGDHAGHWIVGMYFIFEIDKAVVPRRDEGLKYFAHGHETLSHSDLTFFILKVGEIFHVQVE